MEYDPDQPAAKGSAADADPLAVEQAAVSCAAAEPAASERDAEQAAAKPATAKDFHGIPVYWTRADEEDLAKHVLVLHQSEINPAVVKAALAQNKLVLIRAMPFEQATNIFESLVDEFGLRDSYEMLRLFQNVLPDAGLYNYRTP
eukprot:6056007-Prymnesium_polylepis.1